MKKEPQYDDRLKMGKFTSNSRYINFKGLSLDTQGTRILAGM